MTTTTSAIVAPAGDAPASAPSKDRAVHKVERAEWRRLHRHLRMVRTRAVRWLYRVADVPRDKVVSPGYLARRLLVIEPDEEHAGSGYLLVYSSTTLRRWDANHPGGSAPTLRCRADAWPDSRLVAWALGALACKTLREAGHTWWDVGDDCSPRVHRIDDDLPRSSTWTWHAGAVIGVFGYTGWRMLDLAVAEEVLRLWTDREFEPDEEPFDRQLLRERLRRFKKARARAVAPAEVAA
jgi:hypothetical protein